MTTTRLRLVVVALAAMISMVACNSPTAPSTPNPVPTVPPFPSTPPVQSYVRVTRTNPSQNGTTMFYRQDEIYASVEYGVSQADQDEAARAGDIVVTVMCPSIDGTTPIPICFGQLAPGSYGENQHHFHVSLVFNPEATQTNYVIAYLKFVHGEGQNQTERIIASNAYPLVVNWR